MTRWLATLLLVLGCVQILHATTYTAASCAQADVNNCFTGTGGTACTPTGPATAGSTIDIPAGTCTWTAGVSWSNGISVVGAGAGRVIAVDAESTAITLTTGTKTFNNVIGDTAITCSGTPASCSGNTPSISNGETLRIMEDGWDGNFLQGTVSSFSGGVLTMSITSAGGTCGQADSNGMASNCKRWLITTLPSTIICNNLASGQAFSITENATYDASISGIFFGMEKDPRCSAVTSVGHFVEMVWSSTGTPILIHDNFVERSNTVDANGNATINANTNKGVIWNNSFLASPFSTNQIAVIRIKDPGATSILPASWNSVAAWGSADTNENKALFFETNDMHAYNNGATDCDDGCRMVFRNNLIDNSGLGSHGADTSDWGMRTMELYDNLGWFQAYADGTTANLNWWFNQRGGSSVIHDNSFPVISSTDWGSKSDVYLDAYQLQRAAGPDGCWGAGGTPGQYYPAPRQTGLGYVTGLGTAKYTSISGNPTISVNGASDSIGYVGDAEPVYLWNNNRTLTIGIGNGAGAPCTTPDTAANYVVVNRDYFNGTAKPSYTPATYPNPYTGGQPAATPTAPSPMIMTADNVAQYLFGAPLPCGQRGTCEAAARP